MSATAVVTVMLDDLNEIQLEAFNLPERLELLADAPDAFVLSPVVFETSRAGDLAVASDERGNVLHVMGGYGEFS